MAQPTSALPNCSELTPWHDDDADDDDAVWSDNLGGRTAFMGR